MDAPASTGLFDSVSHGIASDIPVFMQEWHIWWGFPYPDRKQEIRHMDTRMVADRDPWRLHWNRSGYPYPGLYDSNNLDVARWQIRCMKAAGIDATAVMVHPELSEGIFFIQESEGDNELLMSLLDIAAEEDFHLFFMDEVAFRPKDSPSRDPEVMTRRAIRFLNKYGDHPGFLEIDGKPVYYYQTFGYWPGVEATQRMIEAVEQEVGPVYWMVFGGIDQLKDVDGVDAVISSASNHRHDRQTREWDFSVQDPATRIATGHAAGKKIGDLIYPKFDGTAQPWRQSEVGVYGKAGRTLEMVVRDTMADEPDFLMLSSWNDWEEGANFEPGWDFDGFTGDPFIYCRAIAHLRGKEFHTPPPPPKESVHPTIWEKLGHGDGAGPIIEEAYRLHTRGGSMEVVVRDSFSPVDGLEVVWGGDAYWIAARPGEDDPVAGLELVAGEVSEPKTVRSLVGPRQSGLARTAMSPVLRFALGDDVASELGSLPNVGTVYGFDPLEPLAGVAVTMPSAEEIPRREPFDAVQTTVTIPLKPANHLREPMQTVWSGWQAIEAQAAQPVILDDDWPISLLGHGRDLGALSLLGPPQTDRLIDAKPQLDDPEGLRVRYRFELPDEVIDTPGLHLLWLRARDAVGNWGSPRLVAVPNYENPWPEYQPELEPPLVRPDAALADRMDNPSSWRILSGGNPRSVELRSLRLQRATRLGNSVVSRDLARPIEGAFTLSLNLLHERYQRGVRVWVTDREGKHGYGFAWDSAGAEQFDGQGRVALLRLASDKAVDWTSQGEVISDWSASGRSAVTGDLAHVELVRTIGGELRLTVDGVEVARAQDDQFSSFERVYLRGNNHQIVGDVILE
ncbi:MAG: hypothetical protein AAF711_00245 [Planctomycetota bacterium]